MKRLATTLLFSIILCVLCVSVVNPSSPAATATQEQQTQSNRLWITPRGVQPFFVIGANYEGPTDRAWQMWEEDQFDPVLIEADFAKARLFGINTLRVFVQRPLRDNINAGDFSKLDTVVALARKYNLWLIITFTDWPEPDLARAAALNARIAARLAAEPHILAYDAKNEPQFTDVVGAIYPSSVPMQSPDLITQYGERVSSAQIPEYRRGEGRSYIPTRMTDEQAYAMANYYKLYIEFLDDASEWAGSHPGMGTLDYIDSPDSAQWQPFLSGMDATLSAWVSTQLALVRQADPGRPITVGYSNIVFAKLPSNRSLTFHSLHRFTAHGSAGLNGTFRLLDNLQRTFPAQPVMLEEFGYAGQVRATGGGVTGFDPRTTANLESAVWLYLYSRGYAGGAKWMLNNFPQGYDPAQNTYGLFDNDGQPKLSAHALRQLAELFSKTSPGAMSTAQPESNSAAIYAYTARDALVTGGKVYTGTNVTYASTAPAQLLMSMHGGGVSLFATDVTTASLYLPSIFGISGADVGRLLFTSTDPQGQTWIPSQPARTGDWVRLNLSPLYKYRLVAIPRAVDRAQSSAEVGTVYFSETGHNLGGEFLRYWQERGGLPIFGYPLTEPFTENGYLVQYFERNRFELHPENGPPYNVLLGRLGADATRGRIFPGIQPFPSEPNHRFFPETGHSLHYAFLGYWERYGGLAQFGYPISEEIRERSATDGREYTVQYFERARFEYHPEYRGTDAEMLLGLLGVGAMKEKGWLP